MTTTADTTPEAAADDLAPRPGLGMRTFGVAIWLASALLWLVSLLGVAAVPFVLTGHVSVSVPAELSEPFSVVFGSPDPGPNLGDRTYIGVDGGRIGVYGNFPVAGQESKHLAEAPTVHAKVAIADDDRDARGVVVVQLAALVGLAWVAVTNLERIATSARAGRPFDRRNTRRLRWVAGALVAWPVVTAAGTWFLDRALDVSPAMTTVDTGPSIWLCIAGAAGLAALGEVFAEGSRLRAFERATI